MKIDAHQHFWIYNPAEYCWIDDSMTELRRNFEGYRGQLEVF